MESKSAFVLLPGSAMRYKVKNTGEEISRREYIKRTEGVSPEEKAYNRVKAGKAKPGITSRAYEKKLQRKRIEVDAPIPEKPVYTETSDGIEIHHMPTKGKHGVSQLVGIYRCRQDRTGIIEILKGYSLSFLSSNKPRYNSAEFMIRRKQAQLNALASKGKTSYGWKIVDIDDEYFISW